MKFPPKKKCNPLNNSHNRQTLNDGRIIFKLVTFFTVYEDNETFFGQYNIDLKNILCTCQKRPIFFNFFISIVFNSSGRWYRLKKKKT